MIEIILSRENGKVKSFIKMRYFPYILQGYINEIGDSLFLCL